MRPKSLSPGSLGPGGGISGGRQRNTVPCPKTTPLFWRAMRTLAGGPRGKRPETKSPSTARMPWSRGSRASYPSASDGQQSGGPAPAAATGQFRAAWRRQNQGSSAATRPKTGQRLAPTIPPESAASHPTASAIECRRLCDPVQNRTHRPAPNATGSQSGQRCRSASAIALQDSAKSRGKSRPLRMESRLLKGGAPS